MISLMSTTLGVQGSYAHQRRIVLEPCTVSFDECTAEIGVRSHVLKLIVVGAADMARKLPTVTGSTCGSSGAWPVSW
jgi:hypothetical protein